jgi:arsenite methyltransferase
MKAEDLKKIVKEKYGEIAGQSKPQAETSCCGTSTCCAGVDYTVFSENYEKLDGYIPDADLNLGCGIPTAFAGIKKGDNVLDLGSGAGNDCFVARAITGETGKVTGLDMTEQMIARARENCLKLKYDNVFFVMGDIEEMPFENDKFDVVISNCVLNLVPDKSKAFSEIFRVLKSGGHFCVSDVVIRGNLPDNLKKDAEMYAGCVAGAIEMTTYLELIRENGFTGITVNKQKEITLPGSVLSKYLTDNEMKMFSSQENGIFSITVSAEKP